MDRFLMICLWVALVSHVIRAIALLANAAEEEREPTAPSRAVNLISGLSLLTTGVCGLVAASRFGPSIWPPN